VYGSFGVDFGCRDGHRVMVVALTEGHWAGLCSVTGTGEVFRALEAALDIDLAREAARYQVRETIAAILRPWFAARDRAQVSAELDRARVLWGRYQEMTEMVAAHRAGAFPVLADFTLPGAAAAITARSPLRWNDEHGDPGTAPALGRGTAAVLAEVLGLTDAEIGKLAAAGVIPGSDHDNG